MVIWAACDPWVIPFVGQVRYQMGARTDDMTPFEIFGENRPVPVPVPGRGHGHRRGGGRWLVTCDHASNTVPPDVCGGNLGIAPEDMARHIAWDVGAEGVARALGAALDSPVICSRFSRLVMDANRGVEDPTLVMQLYDGTIIPGNARISAQEVAQRVQTLYRPYHDAVARLAAGRDDTVIVAVHSFTPCLRGRAPRPWEVGVLYAHQDARLSRPLIAGLRAGGDLCVGDNEPYDGYLPGDSIDLHALQRGRLNTLIEVRNDLIFSSAGQQAWGMRLAPYLVAALEVCDATG